MYKYFAFISYKHRDKRFARKLQEKLEFYGLKSILNELKTKKLPADKTVIQMLEKKTREKSVYFSAQHSSDSFFSNALDFFKDKYRTKFSKNEQKFYPMCRDDGEFSSGNLNEIIENHLDDSKKLIFFCTEESLSDDENVSKYVKKELRYFYERNNGLKNIIFVNLGKNESEKTKINTKLNRFLQQEFDLKIGDEQLTLWKKDKDCHLRIIASILGVDYSLIKSREKIRRRKKRTIVSIVAAVVLILSGWLWTGKIIDDNIEYALEKNEIAESIELLLDTNNIANWTLHSNDKILDALNKVCEYEPGQLLRRVRHSNGYYRSIGESCVSEDENLHVFHNEKNNEDVVYDIVSGDELLRYHYGDGVLILSDNTKVNVESASQGTIEYVDDKSVIIYTSIISGRQKCHLVDIIEKKVKTIDLADEWLVYNISKDGVYYVNNRIDNDNALYFISFDKEGKKIQDNVREHYLNDNGIFAIDTNGMFQGISNCVDIFGSINNDNIYVTSKDNFLYCFDGKTLDLKYEIPCNGNVFKFAENGIVMVGSGNSYESNVEYMLFREENGEIIKNVKAWALPAFDISSDGRNAAYSIDGNIVMEELATGKITTIKCDRPAISCGFRSDDNVLWTVDRRGELCTWAIDAKIGITEMFNEVIFDKNNNDICWLSNEKATYRYDFYKNELTQILNRAVAFAGQSSDCVKISIDIPESKMPLQRWIDKKSGMIILDKNDELLEERYVADEEMQKILFDFKDGLLKQEGWTIDQAQVSADKKHIGIYGKYYDRKGIEHSAFRLYNVEKGTVRFELKYGDDKLYPYEDYKNIEESMEVPVFNIENNRVFVVYEDADDLKMKTVLCDINGKELLINNGYPIYIKGMNKYWSDNVVFSVNSINKIYNFKVDDASVLNKAKDMLSFIEKTNVNVDLIVAQNTETIEYNNNREFYIPDDPSAKPEIRLLCNNIDITTESDIVRLNPSDNIQVNASAPSGVYNVSCSIDNVYTNTSKVPSFVMLIPNEYKNNQVHVLEFVAESATGVTNKLSYKFICDINDIKTIVPRISISRDGQFMTDRKININTETTIKTDVTAAVDIGIEYYFDDDAYDTFFEETGQTTISIPEKYLDGETHIFHLRAKSPKGGTSVWFDYPFKYGEK